MNQLRPRPLALPLAVLALLATTGCAPTLVHVTEAAGPDPEVAASAEEQGALVVYTETTDPYPADQDDAGYPPFQYTGYEVYDGQGHLVAAVTNHGTHDEGPQHVALRPGAYLVRAEGLASRGGFWRRLSRVDVPVRVDHGKVTELHLDSPWRPPSYGKGEGLAALALPGWPVGWSAHAGARLGVEGELRFVGSDVVAELVREARAAHKQPAVSMDDTLDDAVGAVRLGAADLAGVAGEVAPAEGVTCEVVGSDSLAVVVREDSPLTVLSLGEMRGLVQGVRSSGGRSDPTVLVGRGTGAETVVTNPAAVLLPADEILRRVARSSEAVAVTSRRSVAGAEGLRVVDLSPDPASIASPLGRPVALSLCAASHSKNAQAVIAAVHELAAHPAP